MSGEVRELRSGETQLAWQAMRELRPQIGDAAQFAARIDDVQRPQGYRLFAVVRGRPRDGRRRRGVPRARDAVRRDGMLYVDDLSRCPRRVAVVTPRRCWRASTPRRRLGPRAAAPRLGRRLRAPHRPPPIHAPPHGESSRTTSPSGSEPPAPGRAQRAGGVRPRRRPRGAVGSCPPPRVLAGEQVLGPHRVLARALDDAQQVGHRGDLLDLLLDEPLHELLAA